MHRYFVSDQTFPAFSNKTVEFDYSGIRPKGAAIAHMDGKAPGFEPLQKSLENIRRVSAFTTIREYAVSTIMDRCWSAPPS